MDIYKEGSRRNLLFTVDVNGRKMRVSIPDLWSLQLTVLNETYKAYNAGLRKDEDSLLDEPDVRDEDDNMRVQILRDIVRTRQSEAKARMTDEAKRQREAEIDELIREKEREALANMTPPQLRAYKAEYIETGAIPSEVSDGDSS